MTDRMDQSNDSLSDEELLDREADQRNEFLQLEQLEPQQRETRYHLLHGSGLLIRTWERWRRTSLAVRLRGLLSRERRR